MQYLKISRQEPKTKNKSQINIFQLYIVICNNLLATKEKLKHAIKKLAKYIKGILLKIDNQWTLNIKKFAQHFEQQKTIN